MADDDEDIVFMLDLLLTRRGWLVTTASSGHQALEVLRTESFDALVLDLNMPPGSGLEVVEQRRREGDDSPIVLFTGYVAEIEREQVDAQGVTVLDKTEVTSLPGLLEELTSGR